MSEELPSIKPPVMDASAARALIAANQDVGFDPPPIALASAGEEPGAETPPAAIDKPKGGKPKAAKPPAEDPPAPGQDGQPQSDDPQVVAPVDGE